jgi:hypothetical protein
MKGAQVARKATRTTTLAKKQIVSEPAIVEAGLARLRKGKVDVQKRLVGLRTEGARWLKKNPGRAILGSVAGAFALGVAVTKAARRN